LSLGRRDLITVAGLAVIGLTGGLQLAPGVTVIAVTSVAANLAAILGGILVFRDPIGTGMPAGQACRRSSGASSPSGS
jgi:hypothetical protein